MNHFGHEVFAYDIKKKNPMSYVRFSLEPWTDVDVTFICVPDDAVRQTVRLMVDSKVTGLIVIKSTVPVGTTDELMKCYGIHLCHNPEFLREKHSIDDVLNPDRIIIGSCCEGHVSLLSKLYAPLKKPVLVTSPMASELAKLVSNSYLATLITFWNEINEITQRLELSVEEEARLVCSDTRMSSYGTHKFGEPFEGKCIPKDLDYLIQNFRSNDLNPVLLEAVKAFNRKL